MIQNGKNVVLAILIFDIHDTNKLFITEKFQLIIFVNHFVVFI